MKSPESLVVTTLSEREIVMTRIFHAPRRLVFDAWTQPALVRRWLLGPPGWTMPVCEIDLRIGGAYRFVWSGPDGATMAMGGVYREIVAPERIVNTQLFDQDWTGGETVGTLLFAEHDGRTTLINKVLYPSRKARDGALATPMAEGVEAGYRRLDGILASGPALITLAAPLRESLTAETDPRTHRGAEPMHKITPFLWFDNQAEEAMRFYASIFKNSKIGNVTRSGDSGPGPKGKAMSVTFQLEGQEFMALNGGPYFKFTEAISLFVSCENQAEVDEYWEKLSEGGSKSQCGWLKDKYGLSWQIAPAVLGKLLGDPDPAKSNRVMQAMLKMTKIDIAGLERAHRGV